jgi:hypothetical protein
MAETTIIFQQLLLSHEVLAVHVRGVRGEVEEVWHDLRSAVMLEAALNLRMDDEAILSDLNDDC